MREPAKTFEDLLVWQKAHSFVLAVYRITGTFPKHEVYGLSSQFRRAVLAPELDDQKQPEKVPIHSRNR